MKINILLPYKEKFDEDKASSVSITIKNNLLHTKYINDIRIYGQNVENPLFKENFVGLKHPILSLKSKNKSLALKMLKIITEDSDKKQLIEIHNRPYLVNQITKGNRFPISLFFHNDPQTMKGSISIEDRENILNKCVAVFCVSNFIKNQFLSNVSNNCKKVHTLYNGVERNLKKNFPKKKEILYVGRLVPEKGVDIYVEAINLLATNHPDWNFGLIGSFKLGDNIISNTFASEVIRKFNKVGSQAKFYGYQSNSFVQEKMKTASIIIIPSIWQEPFGLVAAEAMSNGSAIIANKIGGIPEIIQDCGVLLEDINPQKLERATDELIKNENLRKKFQNKAWNNSKFSSKNSSKKLDLHRKAIFENYF